MKIITSFPINKRKEEVIDLASYSACRIRYLCGKYPKGKMVIPSGGGNSKPGYLITTIGAIEAVIGFTPVIAIDAWGQNYMPGFDLTGE